MKIDVWFRLLQGDLCKWPMSLSTFMLVCGYMLITMWSCPVVLYVMPFFWRQTYLSFKFFSHLCLFPHIHFSSNIVPGICWHLWVLISTLLLLLLCHEKKLEMHMRNKQYRTCRSQKSQRLVIFLRRCMSGYVKGYDVGLKQVFGFNVS